MWPVRAMQFPDQMISRLQMDIHEKFVVKLETKLKNFLSKSFISCSGAKYIHILSIQQHQIWFKVQL